MGWNTGEHVELRLNWFHTEHVPREGKSGSGYAFGRNGAAIGPDRWSGRTYRDCFVKIR